MFPFVFLKIPFQVSRNTFWHNQISIFSSKKTVVIFTAFCVSNLFRIIFIPNISYCLVVVWNFRGINNLSIFIPDMIIFFFWNGCNVPTNHCFNESAQFFTFTDRFFIFMFIKNLKFASILVSSFTKFSRGLSWKICFASFNRYTESSFQCSIFLLFCVTYNSIISELFISHIYSTLSYCSEAMLSLVNDVIFSFITVSSSTYFTVSYIETLLPYLLFCFRNGSFLKLWITPSLDDCFFSCLHLLAKLFVAPYIYRNAFICISNVIAFLSCWCFYSLSVYFNFSCVFNRCIFLVYVFEEVL